MGKSSLSGCRGRFWTEPTNLMETLLYLYDVQGFTKDMGLIPNMILAKSARPSGSVKTDSQKLG